MWKASLLSLAAVAALCSPAVAAPTPSLLPGDRPWAESSPAIEAVARGFKALETGDLGAAESALTEALKLQPGFAGAFIGMAELAARRGQGAKVDEWLRKAVSADPDGTYTLRVWAKHQLRTGHAADAEVTLRKAVAADPGSLDARLNLGEVQFVGLKKPKLAEATYREALVRFPTHSGTRLALAAVLAAQNRPADAEKQFEQASRDAPGDAEPLLALARYQASRTQIDKALQTLSRAIAAAPSAPQPYVDRGDLLLLKNDVDGATESFRTAVKVAPGAAANAHFRLATLQEARQSWGEAEASYRSALKSQPDFVPALNNLSYMFARRGQNLDEATQLIARALELTPGQGALLDTQGAVLRARGDLDKAASSYESAIATNPRNAAFHYHLGILRSEQGRKQDAQTAFKRALEVDSRFRDAEDARSRLAKLAASR